MHDLARRGTLSHRSQQAETAGQVSSLTPELRHSPSLPQQWQRRRRWRRSCGCARAVQRRAAVSRLLLARGWTSRGRSPEKASGAGRASGSPRLAAPPTGIQQLAQTPLPRRRWQELRSHRLQARCGTRVLACRPCRLWLRRRRPDRHRRRRLSHVHVASDICEAKQQAYHEHS
jgi:hypothetical protein